MIKNNEEFVKVYTTLDAYQAGFLTLKGHIPQFIQQNEKVVFCFDSTEKLYQDINDYSSGATIEALRLAVAVKNLKSQIHSLRRNKNVYLAKT